MTREVLTHVLIPVADAAVQGVREQQSDAEHQGREDYVSDDRDGQRRPIRTMRCGVVDPTVSRRLEERAKCCRHGPSEILFTRRTVG
jgi:hypothetical protein